MSNKAGRQEDSSSITQEAFKGQSYDISNNEVYRDDNEKLIKY